MSSAGTITVQITANEADLRAKLALAQADLARFSGEVKSLSTQMVATGNTGDAALNTALRASTKDAAAAGRAVSGLETELKKVVPAANGAHGSISSITRETRALFDELSSGRTRMVPGTLATLAQAGLGISGGMLAAGAAVVAFVAGLGYLIVKAEEADEALDHLKLETDFAGNLDVSKEKLRQTADELDNLAGVSAKDANLIVSYWARMGHMSADAIEGLSNVTERYAQDTGDKAPEALKKLDSVLSKTNITATELQKVFPGLTHVQSENYIAVAKLGDEHKTIAALMALVQERTGGLREETARANSGWLSSLHVFLQYTMGLRTQAQVIAMNEGAWDRDTAAIERTLKALHAEASGAETVLAAADRAADSEDTRGARVRQTTAHIAALQKGLQLVQSTEKGDQLATDTKKYATAIHQAKDELVALAHQQSQADTLGSRLGAAAARKAAAEAKAEGVVEIKDTEEKISEINADETKGAAERTTLINAEFTKLLNNSKLTGAQRVQIQTQYNNALAAEQKRAANDAQADAKIDANTAVELSRIAFETKRSLLDQEVEAGTITNRQKLEQLISLAQEELSTNVKAQNDAESGYAKDATAFHDAEAKKQIYAAQTAAEIEKLNAQILADDIKTAKADASSWKLGIDEMTSAERSFTDSLLSGRVSLLGALEEATSTFIKKEIEDDLAYYTKKLFLSKADFAAEKAQEQGGLLVHALTETEKTSSTVAGSAARKTVTASEATADNLTLLGRVGKWLAGELGMTAATTTGATTRTTEQAAADTETKVQQSATNVAAATSNAAVAATGAASAVASVPYVGPALAAAAAASTTAALTPYVTLAALDVGAWNVPHDMPAYIHQGETVVPKTFAEGLRGGGGSGFGGNSTSNTLNMHYGPTVNAPGQQSMGQMLSNESSTMRSWFQAQVRSGALKMG